MLELKLATASQVILLGRFVDSTDGNTEETGLTIANTDIKIWKEGATTLASKNSGGATHIANGMYYCTLDATDTDTLGKLEVHVHVSGALPIMRQFMVRPALVYESLVVGGPAFPLLGIIHSGTGQAATGTTFRLDSAAAFADDTVIGGSLLAYGATQGYWQTRSVTDNALTNDVLTVDTWTVTPSGTLTYVLFAGGPASATLPPAVNVTQFGGTNGTFSGGRPEVNTSHWGGTAVGSAVVNTNVIQISGDSTAADNAESFFDGTGYAGTNNVIPTVSTITSFAANVRSAIGMSSANLDTQLSTIDDFLDTEVAAIKAKTDQLTFGATNCVNANIKALNDATSVNDAARFPNIT